MSARKNPAKRKGSSGRGSGPKRPKYSYEVAPDVQLMLEDIVRHLPDEFAHVDVRRVVCYRSRGSTANIYARIWSLPGIWQAALGVEAHYVIEVVERFDRESREEQEKTLIHELMHIPKTFSGNLVPHKCFGKTIDCDSENLYYKRLQLARAVEARAREAAAHAMARRAPPTGSSAPAPAAPVERPAATAPLAAPPSPRAKPPASARTPPLEPPRAKAAAADERPARPGTAVQKTLDFT